MYRINLIKLSSIKIYLKYIFKNTKIFKSLIYNIFIINCIKCLKNAIFNILSLYNVKMILINFLSN